METKMIDESTLIKIVEEATNSDSGSINIESTSADIDGWDSLGHLSIISAITDHLGEGLKKILDWLLLTVFKSYLKYLNRLQTFNLRLF